MKIISREFENILDSNKCPICGLHEINWTQRADAEKEEISVSCPKCKTHFIDVKSSKEECGK